MIDHQNWKTHILKGPETQAFISSGGELVANNFKDLYFVTLGDQEYGEIFQKQFDNFIEALNFINQRFSHFKLEEKTLPPSGGCSSCQAH